MDRALFTGGHEREGGGSHTRSRVLCVRNMWSVTHGGIVRAKSLRPRLRACARLLPCLPTHTHTHQSYVYVCTRRVSRVYVSLILFLYPLSSFSLPRSVFFPLAIPSLSLSLQLTTRQRLLTLAC